MVTGHGPQTFRLTPIACNSAEYVFKYNAGHDVPFTEFTNSHGTAEVISDNGVVSFGLLQSSYTPTTTASRVWTPIGRESTGPLWSRRLGVPKAAAAATTDPTAVAKTPTRPRTALLALRPQTTQIYDHSIEENEDNPKVPSRRPRTL